VLQLLKVSDMPGAAANANSMSDFFR
jgi:hypothetical protein